MGDRAPRADLATLILQAAAIVAPLLALGALALYLVPGGDATAGPAKRAAAPAAATVDFPIPAGDAPRATMPVASGEPESEATGTSDATFPIVQVRRGESIRVFRAPGGRAIDELGDRTEFGSSTVLSVQRVKPGWIGVSTALVPAGRLGWIRADGSSLVAGAVDYSIQVDLSSRRAELIRDDRVVRRWPVTVGAPGSETPVGEFAVTDLFRGDLNPAYGCCALALSATQPNLPAGWSGGDLIAIHGTSGPVGLAESSGCVRSADRDVSALVDTVPLGTPVTIRD